MQALCDLCQLNTASEKDQALQVSCRNRFTSDSPGVKDAVSMF